LNCIESCTENGPPEVAPEWLVEAEKVAAAEKKKMMEWVARQAAKSDASVAEKQAALDKAAKKAADKVALRTDATALFNSEGLENSPFSYASDIRSGQPQINQSWRGYKGQGEVQAVNFTNDGNFTIRNWSDDSKDEYNLVIEGWYLCRPDGVITGRVSEVTFTGLPRPNMIKPKENDFIEGNYAANLNRLDPKKFALTFVAARGRSRSRGGSGTGSFGN
jgi:hypothetical protein